MNKIILNKFTLNFTDQYAGNNLSTKINSLEINLDKFQPDKQLFAINNFKTNGIVFSMTSYFAPHFADTKKQKNSNNNLQISVKNFELKNTNFSFDDNKIIKQKSGFDALHINAKNINAFAKNIFYTIDSSSAIINQFAFKEQSGLVIDTTKVKISYSKNGFAANDLFLKTPQSVVDASLQIRYNSIATILSNPNSTNISASIKNTTIAINDIYTLMPSAKLTLPEIKFKNNSIILNTIIAGNLQQLSIPAFQLKGFSGSVLNASAVLINITDSLKLGYDILISNARILKNDLLKFMPNNNYVGELPADLTLKTHLKGNKINSIIEINANSSLFRFNGNADINHIDNPALLQYNIAIKDARLDRKLIEKFIPKNTIPATIQLPSIILLKGFVKGDINNVSPNIILDGTYGFITVKGYVNNFKNKDAVKYDIQFATKNFAFEKLLTQDSLLGNATLIATAKGTGFDYKKMKSNFDIKVQSAIIKNYNYQNLYLKTTLLSGNIMLLPKNRTGS